MVRCYPQDRCKNSSTSGNLVAEGFLYDDDDDDDGSSWAGTRSSWSMRRGMAEYNRYLGKVWTGLAERSTPDLVDSLMEEIVKGPIGELTDAVDGMKLLF